MLDTVDAQGRLKDREPIAVIDVGSNSVRLVVFEGLVRAPAILFNEKVSAGLGRGIAGTGRMDDNGVKAALAALVRFRALCAQANVSSIFVLATAAAREAENGADFIARAEQIIGTEIQILSGKEEALYSALGIISAFRVPHGVAGDLGGGSLELVDIRGGDIGTGTTLPLGVIRLEERSEQDFKVANKLVLRDLQSRGVVDMCAGRPFYAVGGTWRNIAKLHMHETEYPLHIAHNYEVPSAELLPFLEALVADKSEKLKGIDEVSKSRRALLPYGAIVLRHVIDTLKPDRIVFSAYGVREGFVYSKLPNATKSEDALIAAADELAVLRARSPEHASELAQWTHRCFRAFGIDETVSETRYREAACRLADIGWRAHADYRAAQSLAVIAYGHFVQISHQGRAYISLASYFRYQGLKNEDLAPEIKNITSHRIWDRARYLGAFFRVGYLFTAAMPGVLGDLDWHEDDNGDMILRVPERLKDLVGERPQGRLSQLSKVTGRQIDLQIC